MNAVTGKKDENRRRRSAVFPAVPQTGAPSTMPQPLAQPLREDWTETSSIRQLREHEVTVGIGTLALLNQLARAHSGDEAKRIADSLRMVAGDGVPEVRNLVDALEDRAVALEQQRRLAGRDELTGIANRRAFNEALRREVARAQRSGKPLSLLMLDVDGLKTINDQHGHPAGDMAIQAVANAALSAVRDGDQVFRLGGDEFAVLLPEAEGTEAAIVGERIRRRLHEQPVDGVDVEVSYGHGRLQADEADEQLLVAAADRALYRNKRARRGQVR